MLLRCVVNYYQYSSVCLLSRLGTILLFLLCSTYVFSITQLVSWHQCRKFVLQSAWTVGKVVKFIREVKLPDGAHLLGDLVDQEALASTR
jgi:hypothetical protein